MRNFDVPVIPTPLPSPQKVPKKHEYDDDPYEIELGAEPIVEIDKYIRFSSDQNDINEFWSKNSDRFPNIARVASRILALPSIIRIS